MPIFAMMAFLLLICLGIVLAVGWIIALSFFIGGRRKGSRLQIWLSSGALALTSGLGICLLYLYFAPSNPIIAYRVAFGVLPASDVTELRSNEDGFGDWEKVYLKFKASPETIERLTAKNWSEPVVKTLSREQVTGFGNQEVPSWWKPDEFDKVQSFDGTEPKKKFDEEYEELYYDSESRQAYYSYWGFDQER